MALVDEMQELAKRTTARFDDWSDFLAHSKEVWRERSLGTASGCEGATFIAERGGVWIGMVTGLANQQGQTSQSTLLVAMFVATSVRRKGIGVALVDALTSWARDCKTPKR